MPPEHILTSLKEEMELLYSRSLSCVCVFVCPTDKTLNVEYTVTVTLHKDGRKVQEYIIGIFKSRPKTKERRVTSNIIHGMRPVITSAQKYT
jgi:hypothetical protein